MVNLVNWYQIQVNNKCLTFDQAQFSVVTQLDQFIQKFNSLNFITRLLFAPRKFGYYIYGEVGSGKSMLLNAMYPLINTHRKTRIHFHAFMQNIHLRLAKAAQVENPLFLIAKQLKAQYDIIFLDEMHVNDIATAMILQNLFNNLFKQRIYIITSANYHPDNLWPDGLMRERFLPAISLLKQNLTLIKLNAQHDYRLINDTLNQLFIINDPLNHAKLAQIFAKINLDNHYENNHMLTICEREISCIKSGADIIWFNFRVICGDMRSQLDYLALVKQFKWFIISDIFPLDVNNKDIARRFTWLIDILYDNNSKLALSSSVSLENIFQDSNLVNEFARTLSRLEEMQSKEYLKKS